MPLNVPVILGSVRRDRVGIRVARFAVAALKDRGHQVTLVDPVEYPLPLLDRMYKEYTAGEAPAVLNGWPRSSSRPTLMSSCRPSTTTPFRRPCRTCSTTSSKSISSSRRRSCAIRPGAFGGVRAAMQLRAMLAEMGMSSIPSLLPFPKAQDMLDADGRPTGDRPGKSADRFFAELEWYAVALKAARAGGTPY